MYKFEKGVWTDPVYLGHAWCTSISAINISFFSQIVIYVVLFYNRDLKTFYQRFLWSLHTYLSINVGVLNGDLFILISHNIRQRYSTLYRHYTYFPTLSSMLALHYILCNSFCFANLADNHLCLFLSGKQIYMLQEIANIRPPIASHSDSSHV